MKLGAVCAQPTHHHTGQRRSRLALHVCVTPPPRPLRRSWPRRRPWRGGPTCSVRTCLNGQVRCHRGGGIGGFGAGWLEQPGPSGGAPSGRASRPLWECRSARSRQARPEKAREPRAGALPGGSIRSAALPAHPRHTAAPPPQGGATLAGAELAVSAHCLWTGGGKGGAA